MATPNPTHSQGTATQAVAQAPAPQKRPMDVLNDKLKDMRIMEKFENALKENASTFIASVIELCSNDDKLQRCDANSIIREALKAATLHLPINKALGQAFIVPYNNTVTDERGNKVKKYEPTFQIGYKGYYQMAMRTGKYRIINADVVYEGELRKTSKLKGEIDVEGTRTSDKIIGYFAYLETVDGFSKTLYMTVEEMAKHAKRYSKSLMYKKEATVEYLVSLSQLPFQPESAGNVGWLGNFHSMAIKTVMRNLLARYGYLSVDMQKAVVTDDGGEEQAKLPAASEAKVIDVATVDFEEVSPAPVFEAQVQPQAPVAEEIDPGF